MGKAIIGFAMSSDGFINAGNGNILFGAIKSAERNTGNCQQCRARALALCQRTPD